MTISDEIFDITFKNRIPLYTTIEVTYKCNLKCIHCYLPTNYRTKKDLSTEVIKKVIRDIYKLGGLYIVFTGGEPLLRKDIFELIRYAKKLNFVVLLFTNGTLIDKLVAKKLKVSAVDQVEISLYGEKFSHEKITRQKDSFEKVLSAIKYLKNNDIKVTIKSPIMKQNYNDYKYLNDITRWFDVECKFDFVLTPRNNGDKQPQKYIISNKKIKNFLSLGKYHSTSKDFFSNLICSAGRNIVGISAEGEVEPCLQFPFSAGNIKNEPFKKIWYSKKMRDLAEPQYSQFTECKKCILISNCNRCPGLAYIETKNLYGCSKTAKNLATILSSK
ncbi:MAG: radical SAM protein [Endomicrobiia bacterium]